MLAGVLVGRNHCGIVFSYFLGLLANTFVRPDEVMRTFRLPFYGAVSQISDMRTKLDRSAQLISFSAALGGLVAVLLLLILFDPLISSARHWVVDGVGPILVGNSK